MNLLIPEELKEEVQSKIGRNIMLFQKMEGILKTLLAHSQLSGYASELETIKEKQVSTIRTQTMGQLAGRYIANTFSGSEKTEPQEGLKEIWGSFDFTIQCDLDYYEERKKSLEMIVTERNELIHHFLDKWDLKSINGWEEAKVCLDEQRKKMLLELGHLNIHVNGLQKTKKIMTDFFDSNEFYNCFDILRLRQSDISNLLREFSMNNSRTNGWTILSNAGKFIRQYKPDEYGRLKELYGYNKLKEFVLATGLFDLYEEPTNKGGTRIIYRLKTEVDERNFNEPSFNFIIKN